MKKSQTLFCHEAWRNRHVFGASEFWSATVSQTLSNAVSNALQRGFSCSSQTWANVSDSTTCPGWRSAALPCSQTSLHHFYSQEHACLAERSSDCRAAWPGTRLWTVTKSALKDSTGACASSRSRPCPSFQESNRPMTLQQFLQQQALLSAPQPWQLPRSHAPW